MSARFARSAQAPSGTSETQLNRSTNLPGSSGHGALLGCRRAGAAFQRSHIRSIMATLRRIPAGLGFAEPRITSPIHVRNPSKELSASSVRICNLIYSVGREQLSTLQLIRGSSDQSSSHPPSDSLGATIDVELRVYTSHIRVDGVRTHVEALCNVAFGVAF